jgi:hypothetical protein
MNTPVVSLCGLDAGQEVALFRKISGYKSFLKPLGTELAFSHINI